VDIGPGNKVWAWLRSTLEWLAPGLNMNGWDAPGLYDKYGYPYKSRPFVIFGLARFRQLISGLQSLRGKILSRSELADRKCRVCVLYAAVFEIVVSSGVLLFGNRCANTKFFARYVR